MNAIARTGTRRASDRALDDRSPSDPEANHLGRNGVSVAPTHREKQPSADRRRSPPARRERGPEGGLYIRPRA